MSKVVIEFTVPGVFYRKPAPEEPPFKEEGDIVSEGEVIGLVELMKTFIEIKATASGTLVKFLANEEDTVDVGQAVAEIES